MVRLVHSYTSIHKSLPLVSEILILKFPIYFEQRLIAVDGNDTKKRTFFFSANNFAMQGKRKTISGQDVLNAMSEMEFERFVEPLKKSLEGEKVIIVYSMT